MNKIVLKNSQLFEIHEGLVQLSKLKTPSFKVAETIAENRKTISDRISIVTEASMAICEGFAKRDENGNVIKSQVVEGGQTLMKYDFENNEAAQKSQEEVSKLYAREKEFELFFFNKSDLEKMDGFTGELILLLKPLIS